MSVASWWLQKIVCVFNKNRAAPYSYNTKKYSPTRNLSWETDRIQYSCSISLTELSCPEYFLFVSFKISPLAKVVHFARKNIKYIIFPLIRRLTIYINGSIVERCNPVLGDICHFFVKDIVRRFTIHTDGLIIGGRNPVLVTSVILSTRDIVRHSQFIQIDTLSEDLTLY